MAIDSAMINVTGLQLIIIAPLDTSLLLASPADAI